MELLRVDEPELEDLHELIDVSGFENIDEIEQVGDDWVAKKGVPSHLWKYWKEDLKRNHVNWQEFQKVTSDLKWKIEGWALNEESWDSLLKKYAEKLDADID